MSLRNSFTFRARDKVLELGRRTRLMGVVNVTPDSFSDGGRFFSPERATEHALELIESGADLVDIGGESTRPGASPVSAAEEIDRVVPVLEALRPECRVPISVDTYKSSVALASLEAGADLVNDISGLSFDPDLASIAADWQAGLVLMHIRGTPAIMHQLPPCEDVVGLVKKELQLSVNKAYKSGIDHGRIVLDPGIGFGKSAEENLTLLANLSELAELGLPLLVGPSRKSFIGRILGRSVGERVLGTAAAAAVCIQNGAHLLRIHDISEIRQISDMVDSIYLGSVTLATG